MINETVVELSRLQFALTALYHFLFVPLTLGMSFLLAIMETTYVITGRQVYKDMTRFWGKLFGINFALGVATGLTMEFQFGTNWSYFSHYVGDIFGAPLAIEGLMAFFLESTLVGLFFFGWDRLSRAKHCAVTWLVAIASNLSALWILIANGWMQNPVGAHFNYETMRMELSSFSTLLFNPVAQVKFVHTVSAGYCTGAIFVLVISSYYLLKGRDLPFARRSFAIAAAFGLAASLSVIVLGDESGYEMGDVQKTKLAAIEGEWQTAPAPAAWTLIGFPNQKLKETEYSIKIPGVLGLIATRSLDEKVTGIDDLMKYHRQRIINGIYAYQLLTKLKAGTATPAEKANFDKVKNDLGYGLLVKVYNPEMKNITKAQIDAAVNSSVPEVAPLFWAFRIMVACGGLMLLLFAAAFYQNARRRIGLNRTFLKICVLALPLPWLACECGWFVAEFGRQPWAIGEILPTGLAVSNLSETDILITMISMIGLYTLFLVAEMYLMIRFSKQGPSSLHTGRYALEQEASATAKEI
ncbi:cytochrome ubiquinol oxidase subunit I [Celerinatantimonas diazotrophica]|uniref:Cytochrome bd-I ubiquinol oxidase subunit 1 apoprotein n=1 Tax=Celerinatantimonas diazotrophica TaxID=412034 RepID=A0A4R1J7W7_9GAMM|nr:cytochrome ubiquinol oxidase subunit I [Celerinatantimonas diazotrophica]TCK46608.1 cytochrome bd-I ubiquinol oxidase subunit 1 apoprotein [Celerinatantimonas diazotrophica]CAG9296658.1 Cytochrome bd-I ubiquinol oxidase subunit 1 [Celerinatantimonas diazotrophica]